MPTLSPGAWPKAQKHRSEVIDDDHLRYHLSKPQADGATEPQLTPLELIDWIAAFVPPPRVHPDDDSIAQPEPEVEFDQSVQWSPALPLPSSIGGRG